LSLAAAPWHVTRSLAARTREVARERPFLVEALAAGVVNYTAAARFLTPEIDGDPGEEAVATALGRFAEEIERSVTDADARVSIQRGVGLVPASEEALLTVGDRGVVPGEGDHTALVASGDVDTAALAAALSRLSTAGVDPVAAGVVAGTLVVVVPRREGADALRVLESALAAVPAVDAG
jgi:hypothetical protein